MNAEAARTMTINAENAETAINAEIAESAETMINAEIAEGRYS